MFKAEDNIELCLKWGEEETLEEHLQIWKSVWSQQPPTQATSLWKKEHLPRPGYWNSLTTNSQSTKMVYKRQWKMKADESHSEEYIRQSIDQGEGQWHEVNQGDKN